MVYKTIVPHSLDDYFQTQPIGSLDKAIGNNLYGINHQQIPGKVPSNKDTYGLTFFVRPQLNLQKDNIRNSRLFSSLLTDEVKTIQSFVRATLDPRIINGYSLYKDNSATFNQPGVNIPIVDNLNAFIPILTNDITAISGWPDITAPVFTSKTGLYNESYSMVDGVTRNFETFDLQASFRNTKGDPILFLFYVWLHYSSLVFEGVLVPYLDFITENEIDYNTRIYRLVLDQQKNEVRKIAATGASFPISVSAGSYFDYNNEKPYNDQNNVITIAFKSMGVNYQDDILIKEFNDTVTIFNPSMGDKLRKTEMSKITKQMIAVYGLNNRGYPRIDPVNNELEWYVPNSTLMSAWNNNVKNSLPIKSHFNLGDLA